jgi:hypothetical protein
LFLKFPAEISIDFVLLIKNHNSIRIYIICASLSELVGHVPLEGLNGWLGGMWGLEITAHINGQHNTKMNITVTIHFLQKERLLFVLMRDCSLTK